MPVAHPIAPAFPMKPLFFICISFFSLCLALGSPAMAGVGTNPASGNPQDYGGAGDWNGSGDPDQLTNDAGATVSGNIYGNPNTDVTGYDGGGNTINNAGTVDDNIYGSYNQAGGVSGDGNTITNSGTVSDAVYGSYNLGSSSSGGSNTITNTATGAVTNDIIGSDNQGDGSSGCKNTIVNAGNVTGDVVATSNVGAGRPGRASQHRQQRHGGRRCNRQRQPGRR